MAPVYGPVSWSVDRNLRRVLPVYVTVLPLFLQQRKKMLYHLADLHSNCNLVVEMALQAQIVQRNAASCSASNIFFLNELTNRMKCLRTTLAAVVIKIHF